MRSVRTTRRVHRALLPMEVYKEESKSLFLQSQEFIDILLSQILWFCVCNMSFLRYTLLALAGATQCLAQNATKPNIVLIFPDDQDFRLGSTEHMPILQKELVQKGTQFNNHYATIALCCPSRASLLRGQAAHNTNITDVSSPGGNYAKFMVSKENEDYLPHWLVAAGYNAECKLPGILWGESWPNMNRYR